MYMNCIGEQKVANDKESNTDVTCKYILNVAHETNAQINSSPLRRNRKKILPLIVSVKGVGILCALWH
jgi:hypothetical protein